MKGQINILGLIGIGVSATIALVGGYFSQSYRTDNKIQVTQTQVIEVRERIARLEEAVQTIKIDNQLTRQEIKELIREIKAKK